MKIALVCTINSQELQKSCIQKLFGDPGDYAHKFANETFANRLPIFQNRIHFNEYDFVHTVSVDYHMQVTLSSNNYFGRVEFGNFIYQNDSVSQYFHFMPGTKQVTTINNYYHTYNKRLRIYFRRILYFVLFVKV